MNCKLGKNVTQWKTVDVRERKNPSSLLQVNGNWEGAGFDFLSGGRLGVSVVFRVHCIGTVRLESPRSLKGGSPLGAGQ